MKLLQSEIKYDNIYVNIIYVKGERRMNTQNIGKIIKNARLAKKMTQSEVVGDFITRNMLSQIESGAAMPSVKTLEYLCGVLDIQLDSFNDNEDNGGQQNQSAGYFEIRKLFEDGLYEEVTACECPQDFEDEYSSLMSLSYLNMAQELSHSEKIEDCQKCVEYAKKAAELSEKGIFSNLSVAESANAIVRAAAAKLSEYYSSLV